VAGIMNFRILTDFIWTGGQPDEEQVSKLQEQGVTTIVNIAPYDERYSIEDEPGLVKSLGMNYHHHPVDFSGPTLNDYAVVKSIVKQYPDERIFIHCAANYRVSVFLANFAVDELGWTVKRRDDFIGGVWDLNGFFVWSSFHDELARSIERDLS